MAFRLKPSRSLDARAPTARQSKTREPVSGVKLTLDMAALGLKAGSVAAFDAYTRRNRPLTGNTVTVDIDEANYRLIWLEALR